MERGMKKVSKSQPRQQVSYSVFETDETFLHASGGMHRPSIQNRVPSLARLTSP
jgi:hypothetical protein